MELSVAIIIFLLKTGIKQLDSNYSVPSFFEDILGAFGEKAGTNIAGLIRKSHYEVDNILKDDRLVEMGIAANRTAIVRENVKEILKQIKISDNMLSDYNCDAEEITNYIISNYASSIGISDDETTLRDVKRILFEIISIDINIAQQDEAFINGIIIDTHRIVKDHTSALKELKQDIRQESSNIIADFKMLLAEQTRTLNEQLRQPYTTWVLNENEYASWSVKTTEAKVGLDVDTMEAFIDYSEGGHNNE